LQWQSQTYRNIPGYSPTICRDALLPAWSPSTFSLSHHDDWRPILQITYALSFYLGGLNPTNLRIFNLLIHIASAVLVYAIVKDFERVLRLKHYFTDARYSLALVYLKQRDLTQGEQHCELILKVDRRDVRAYQCLGRILMEQRDFESASRIYERGLAFLPANQQLWRDLSLTYAARGMFGPALTARQKSITFAALSPN
jgi:tetratricopeptide (TPR) repeat protein